MRIQLRSGIGQAERKMTAWNLTEYRALLAALESIFLRIEERCEARKR